ncbi:hypothetical protein B0H11DRAFT_2056969 [Mycena galericulata]|nr:hypothetical protein B0H11DRAFT_2056969 [Mycena galericulata]
MPPMFTWIWANLALLLLPNVVAKLSVVQCVTAELVPLAHQSRRSLPNSSSDSGACITTAIANRALSSSIIPTSTSIPSATFTPASPAPAPVNSSNGTHWNIYPIVLEVFLGLLVVALAVGLLLRWRKRRIQRAVNQQGPVGPPPQQVQTREVAEHNVPMSTVTAERGQLPPSMPVASTSSGSGVEGRTGDTITLEPR